MKSKNRPKAAAFLRAIAPRQSPRCIEKMHADTPKYEASDQTCQLTDSQPQNCTHGGPDMIDEPQVGMEFPTEKSAYDFYNEYARKVGFSVRKNSSIKVDGIIVRRAYCCCKQGLKSEKSTASFHRADTRTNCPAKLSIKLHTNGNFVVYRFEPNHNHQVVPTSKVHLLRSHRSKSDTKKNCMVGARSSRLTSETTKDTKEILGREDAENELLGFQSINYKNYMCIKQRKEMEKRDAGAILEYFQKKQVEDPSFFYAIQLNGDDQITNFFWVDTKSLVDYSFFGDVVCFDMTYRLNKYGRPFAPFFGVNHQKRIIVFGAALLYDETVESFKWLFEAFISAMCGKQPVTILTDQCEAVAAAIKTVFPGTSHRLCAWQIFQNAKRDLNNVFYGSRSFESDFGKCIYEYEDEETFLRAWQNMLVKYGLTENKWLKDLLEQREKWASAYSRNTFCADLMNMLQSESVNNVLKNKLNSQQDISCFFKNYEEVIFESRHNEVKSDLNMRETIPRLFANVKVLKEASLAYTPEVFELFQKEYKEFLNLELFKCGESGMISEFQVTCNENSVKCSVTYDSSSGTVSCSCKKFEFVGILCSHALKVLDFYNIKALPPQYILLRWHKDAKVGVVTGNHGFVVEDDPKEATRKRFNALCNGMITIVDLAAEHNETFKIAEQYYEKLHDGVMERTKDMTEVPQ